MLRNLVVLAAVSLMGPPVLAQQRQTVGPEGPASAFSQVVGRPTDRTVTISLLSTTGVEAIVEYGTEHDRYTTTTPVRSLTAGKPAEFELASLLPGTKYFYRVGTRHPGAAEFVKGDEAVFRTQRKRGESFTFALQGDSHPERLGKMYDPDLYVQTMKNVSKDAPDFYFLMGDDFSIERLIERKTQTQSAVDAIYAHQRGFLGLVGRSTAIMLVNGNHEQAAKYLLDGTASSFAVLAGKARTTFYPLPAPDGFHTGNAETVEHVGLLRDYYAWEWGDALFVVIDPYWHSDVPVDNEAGTRAPQRDAGREPPAPGESNRDAKRRAREAGGGNPGEQPANRQGKGSRDLWQITLGDTQYQWLSRTLRESKAPFKFVFSHHVMGTGRGGVEVAGQFEWGGEDKRGVDRFFQMRPTWKQPIHDLMRDTGVTIFFQGHDHLYAHQELDGVVYQTVPNPADSTFTAFNRQAYKSGDIFPNSGHLRVTVTPQSTRVEYVRSFRVQDEGEGKANGSIAHSYMVKPRVPAAPAASKPPEPKP